MLSYTLLGYTTLCLLYEINKAARTSVSILGLSQPSSHGGFRFFRCTNDDEFGDVNAGISRLVTILSPYSWVDADGEW